ncbi:MAG: hypothetical protein MJZ34_15350 [Paludibacteraceae bacterium]|nr:hypothetical protein [Paludibacteraceae bacterium]
MQCIENEFLKVTVNDELGGSLTSIFDKKLNQERQYQPVEGSWSGQDVVIFPFVARLNGTYKVGDNEYSMKNHGLARYHGFEVVKNDGEELTLRFAYDENTLKEYPYEFVLNVTYRLDGSSLEAVYSVYNPSFKPIYFGLGGHPALKIDEDEGNEIKGNHILFPKNTKVVKMKLDPTFSYIVGEEEETVLERIDLNRDLFRKEGTLMYRVNNLKECTLVRKNGQQIRYEFKNNAYLAIWTNPSKGDYVCVEPWTSLPDYLDAPKEYSEKKTLVGLSPKLTYTMSYKMIF